MLKALELTGFKSFADKTRFEFPEGITVVVGPNGSGKSNIVDAIKWVLGEQSAKSLRGKDMSDVIFKGSSGSNARRPANSATATIVLDNANRGFAFDSDEVHVSRRVYRSGESEYLINGEASRLKDIKELFRGTGVGTDAYSLIEQGKVERMLQANPRDRRAIFEEAAGISRFKARKIEAQRRLSRVDGNLVRLADIVEEVGNRYRSVKAQASKASRYKEYSDRLRLLRTHVARTDLQVYLEKLSAIEREVAEADTGRQSLSNEIGKLKAGVDDSENKLGEITRTATEQQEAAAKLREKIAQAESQVQLNKTRLVDLEQRKVQLNDQAERSSRRRIELRSRIENTEKESESAEINYRESHDLLAACESEFRRIHDQIEHWSTQNESRRAQHGQLTGLIAQLVRQVSSNDAQIENLTATEHRIQVAREQHERALAEYQAELSRNQQDSERIQREAEGIDTNLAESRQQQEKLSAELTNAQTELRELTHQHIAFSQRAEVIEELERSLEGVNAGAREILKGGKSATSGPLTEVVGLVADLISVNVQHASIVDVALGEFAQYVIVKGNQVTNEIANERLKLNGRVGLIQLDQPPTLGTDPSISLNGMEGVIGRTDRLVQVQPEYQNFIRQLLGGTWVVKNLDEAVKLHQELEPDQLVRFVTIDGEIIEADGTVIAGPKSLSIGLISRRSELRALYREIERLDEQIEATKTKVQDLTVAEKQASASVQKQINQNRELASQLNERKQQAKLTQENVRKVTAQLREAETELKGTTSRLQQIQRQLQSERAELTAHDASIASLISLIESEEGLAKQGLSERNKLEKEASSARVRLAKAEQTLDGIQNRLAQANAEFEEQELTQQEIEKELQTVEQASATAGEQIQTGSRTLTELTTERQVVEDGLARVNRSRIEMDDQRRELALQLTEKRDQFRAWEDRVHQAKLRGEQIEMQKQQLVERLQDDYGIEVTALLSSTPPETAFDEREKVDEEIALLRKRISEIGGVNLDALQELEELETRYQTMESQYQDLIQAKETLEKIISRIDADSRKLFVETLEAIRINFQKLFRQTFGGGQADLILEEGVDPLEAGVEVVATPPGKSQFSNSLLSGGEKALTAVSLLMAIFQFRPSPFCVLDEVDAPFDEANIGRFIDVLKSFLGWTRFVIVTHSKKTMTAATTLYGITMQESGVSKRVSVRFEDVSDEGEISVEAVKRTERTERSDGDAA